MSFSGVYHLHKHVQQRVAVRPGLRLLQLLLAPDHLHPPMLPLALLLAAALHFAPPGRRRRGRCYPTRRHGRRRLSLLGRGRGHAQAKRRQRQVPGHRVEVVAAG